jgi:hypothetical protein
MMKNEIVVLLKERLGFLEQGSVNAVELSREEAQSILAFLEPPPVDPSQAPRPPGLLRRLQK